ncbi:MAG: DUF814 domain-containing protein [Planctomycetes bacterium]|nr:DUF814 domain-containing protein [Planctomycetota bacterium]
MSLAPTSPSAPLAAELIAALAAEAHAAAAGMVVRDLIDAPGGGRLLLLARPGEERLALRLLIVAAPGRARLHLVPQRPPDQPSPAQSAFTRDAAPHVRGATIRCIAARPADRLVQIELAPAHAAGAASWRMVAELFGAAPNLLLVDERDTIRALERRRGGRRPCAVGTRYAAPAPLSGPARPGAPLPAAPPGEFARALPLAAAADAAYRRLDLEAECDLALRAAGAALARERTRQERLSQRLAEQLAAPEDAARLRELGDLLSAGFAAIRSGLDALEVDDLYRGGRVRIPLDPALAPRANVEAYYRRARRLERAQTVARARLRQARERLTLLESLAAQLEQARAAGSLPQALAGALARAGLLSPRSEQKAPAGQAQGARAPLPGIRRFRLGSGLEVLVGKSNADNDRLTLSIARGNDLWLHVHGGAGSHVVIRLPRGRTASLEDLLDAAALAVHFSKRRGAAGAEVIYTQRKHVRKERGAKPGAVSVARSKTLFVTGAAERARRLVAAQDDATPPGSLP